MTFNFNNIFYIFIFLCFLYYIISKNVKIPFIKDQNHYYNNCFDYLLDLDYFYMSNKLFTYFSILLYFIFNCLIFLILRLQMIGAIKLIGTASMSLNIMSIFNIFLFLLSIMLYLHILDLIFFPHIIKLHFYLIRQDNWYFNLHEFGRDRGYMIFHHLFDSLIDMFPEEIRLKKNTSKHPLLFNIFYTSAVLLLHHLRHHMSRFVYYLPRSLLIISIVYDLYHSQFQYMYYFLLLYFITNMIKKIRKFFYEKDCVYDDVINRYFYEDETTYIKAHKLFLEKKDLNAFYASSTEVINWKISRIFGNLEEIVNYFKVGLKVYYIVDPENIITIKRLQFTAMRLNILSLLLLSNIFYIYFANKYKIILTFIEYPIHVYHVLLPLFIITILCNGKILYPIENSQQEEGENKNFIRIFMCSIILQTIIILYIMLKNHVILKPNEFIINYEYIKIIESFTIEEKIEYIKRYLDIIIPDSLNMTEYKTMLKEKMITFIENSKSEVTLESLRNMIDNDIKLKMRNV